MNCSTLKMWSCSDLIIQVSECRWAMPTSAETMCVIAWSTIGSAILSAQSCLKWADEESTAIPAALTFQPVVSFHFYFFKYFSLVLLIFLSQFETKMITIKQNYERMLSYWSQRNVRELQWLAQFQSARARHNKIKNNGSALHLLTLTVTLLSF